MSNGGCDNNAMCSNTLGTRTCTCKMGYTGNGTYCENINECMTNDGGCNANANCTDTIGSRNCQCKTGYSGNKKIFLTLHHSCSISLHFLFLFLYPKSSSNREITSRRLLDIVGKIELWRLFAEAMQNATKIGRQMMWMYWTFIIASWED